MYSMAASVSEPVISEIPTRPTVGRACGGAHAVLLGLRRSEGKSAGQAGVGHKPLLAGENGSEHLSPPNALGPERGRSWRRTRRLP